MTKEKERKYYDNKVEKRDERGNNRNTTTSTITNKNMGKRVRKN